MTVSNKIVSKVVSAIRPFYEFEEYLSNHVQEIAYDASYNLKEEDFPAIFASPVVQEPLQKLIKESCLAYLRAYHNWLNEKQK